MSVACFALAYLVKAWEAGPIHKQYSLIDVLLSISLIMYYPLDISETKLDK